MASFIRNCLPIFKVSERLIRSKLRKLQISGAYQSIYNIHITQIHQKKRKNLAEGKALPLIQYPPKAKGDVIDVWQNITVGELANVLKRDVNYVSDLFLGEVRGKHTVISNLKELQNAIRRGGKRMRVIAKPTDKKEEVKDRDAYPRPPPTKAELKPRPPIVTVMGHVDHGKTTLLDALRHSSVVEQEFGGITQHIGAFSVKLETGALVTFLDTPGHAAFSAMRERGANLTDIIVLVVAADDGVMEQTVECIRMARQAKVPILVAINKIDAPKADVDNAEQMLMQKGVQVERLGGDVQSVHISALKRTNLKQLTEALALQAEILQIGGDPTGPVEAVVVESRLDVHRGSLCTIIVQRGTLKRGAVLVADTTMAKVRLLRNSQGQILDAVGPGCPAEVEGWKDVPPAGELVLQVESEKRAREVTRCREEKKELAKVKEDSVVIAAKMEQHEKEYKEQLQLKRRIGRFKMRPSGPRKPEIAPNDDSPFLNIVLKADVDGTLEAILETLSTYHSIECKLDIVSYGIGPVTENDVELAKAFQGVVYTFNVVCLANAQQLADQEGVSVKAHNVIYRLVDSIKEDINARLPPKQVEDVIGEAVVAQQFLINEGKKKVPVAGCRCEKGVLKRAALFRVIRNGQVLHEGPLESMRYLKSEADSIKTGSDCGLLFKDKSLLFEAGDRIVCFENKMEPQFTKWNPGF